MGVEAGLLIIEYNMTEFINDKITFFPLEIIQGNYTSSTAMADAHEREFMFPDHDLRYGCMNLRCLPFNRKEEICNTMRDLSKKNPLSDQQHCTVL